MAPKRYFRIDYCSEIKLSGIAHGPAGGGASTPIGEIDRRSGRPI
jgi:hypothetical protein